MAKPMILAPDLDARLERWANERRIPVAELVGRILENSVALHEALHQEEPISIGGASQIVPATAVATQTAPTRDFTEERHPHDMDQG